MVLGRSEEALTREERVEFRGFGIFEVRPRKTGIGRNPRNNVEVHSRIGTPALALMPSESLAIHYLRVDERPLEASRYDMT